MKIQEVILKAISKQIHWTEAADIIGVSYRTMKRWKLRYQQQGYDGLFDRRGKTPSPKRVPLQELENILTLYRERYLGFNLTHFHEKLRVHGIHRGYTFVKNALQSAGLVEKSKARGHYHRRRPRRPLKGMMLHLDGSPYAWIPALPDQMFDLLVLMDDATNEIYDMELVAQEDTLGCMKLLKDCIQKQGIFCSLYTDRASHFFLTPKAGQPVKEDHLTQMGRALNELSITAIPSYQIQGRGRSERMNRTLQGRLPSELRLDGIKTVESANQFIKKVYQPQHNKRFTVKPEKPESAFIPVAPHLNLDLIFSIKEPRTVNPDHTVQFQRLILQIPPSSLRASFAGCRVIVHQHIDHTLTIAFGPHPLGRYDSSGNPLMAKNHCSYRRAA
jgi:transposase